MLVCFSQGYSLSHHWIPRMHTYAHVTYTFRMIFFFCFQGAHKSYRLRPLLHFLPAITSWTYPRLKEWVFQPPPSPPNLVYGFIKYTNIFFFFFFLSFLPFSSSSYFFFLSLSIILFFFFFFISFSPFSVVSVSSGHHATPPFPSSFTIPKDRRRHHPKPFSLSLSDFTEKPSCASRASSVNPL